MCIETHTTYPCLHPNTSPSVLHRCRSFLFRGGLTRCPPDNTIHKNWYTDDVCGECQNRIWSRSRSAGEEQIAATSVGRGITQEALRRMRPEIENLISSSAATRSPLPPPSTPVAPTSATSSFPYLSVPSSSRPSASTSASVSRPSASTSLGSNPPSRLPPLTRAATASRAEQMFAPDGFYEVVEAEAPRPHTSSGAVPASSSYRRAVHELPAGEVPLSRPVTSVNAARHGYLFASNSSSARSSSCSRPPLAPRSGLVANSGRAMMAVDDAPPPPYEAAVRSRRAPSANIAVVGSSADGRGGSGGSGGPMPSPRREVTDLNSYSYAERERRRRLVRRNGAVYR